MQQPEAKRQKVENEPLKGNSTPKSNLHEMDKNSVEANNEQETDSETQNIDPRELNVNHQQSQDQKSNLESDSSEEEQADAAGPVGLDYFTIVAFNEKETEIIHDDARCDGFWPWIEKYSRFGIPSLLHSLGVPKQEYFFPDLDQETLATTVLFPLLRSKFTEKFKKRTRIEEHSTFEHAVELIRKSQNILVLTGAGVSVSCGIPDFRSKNGIYSRLSEFELSDPQEMFDLEYFKFRPETFYSFAKEIYPSNFKPSPSHHFIKILEEKGKLLRNYTQNIDTLENICGIKNVVQCHGSFATATCITCGYKVPGKEIEKDIFEQRVPPCPKCVNQELGIMKPDIVFFGENLPQTFHSCFKQDREKVDLLIVMGSSLKVAPVANVMDRIPANVPQILINMESLHHMSRFDIHLLGYSDVVTRALLHALGWNDGPNLIKPSKHGIESKIQATSTPLYTSTKTLPLGGKSLPGKSVPLVAEPVKRDENDLSYKAGTLPWHWLFQGAVEPKVIKETGQVLMSDEESEGESSGTDSDMTEDSNTPEPEENPI